MAPEVNEILDILSMLLSDYSIPRNIKSVLEDTKKVVESKELEIVALSDVVYKLQDVCEDINLPISVKPDLWMLLSKLEGLKEIKKKKK
jgi:uncharacterized protein (UPF0147 family)